jgi:hypothetical protein
MSRVETSAGEPLRRLRDARDAYRDADDAVAEYGEDDLQTAADALDRADSLLAKYEGDATGTGDFQAFVEFQGQFETLTENLPEDLPGREAFEDANEILAQRRLSPSDFERARETLAPVRDLAGRLETRRTASATLDEARRAVKSRIDEIDERIAELEQIEAFGDADLSAPTHEIEEPIAAYDDAVSEAFASFRHDASSRAVLNVVRETRHYPLVDFERPPEELLTYLRESAVGEEPIRTLLNYEEYSMSKLEHYVPDPSTFRTRISVHRTYLDRLSAEPLTVGSPPPKAGYLRAFARELVSVTAKFAPEEVVSQARELYRLGKRDDYERLRLAARADAELTDEQRERLASGAVEDEREELEAERERLQSALDDEIER